MKRECSEHGACGPLVGADDPTDEHMRKAGWRNRQFERWSRPWRGRSNRTFGVVAAFAALAPRHDLHVAPDCTHFCFTPHLWAPVWRAAAAAT